MGRTGRWPAMAVTLGVALVLAGCARSTLRAASSGSPAPGASESPSATPSVPYVSGGSGVGTATAGSGIMVSASPVPKATVTPPPPSPSPKLSPVPSPSPLPVSGSGVRGTVTAGPTCPVERIDSPCPPDPLSVPVQALNASGAVIGSTTSGTDGRYGMALAPGSYTLHVVMSSMFPRCPDAPATVAPNAVSTVDITCDTGIR